MKCNTNTTNRLLFNQVAEDYDRVRPTYPDEVFARISQYAGLTAVFNVLEIGCGTGQATLPMARLGVRLLAIDPGLRLLEFAQAKVKAYPNVSFRNCLFEEVELPSESFDLIISATAFHWIPPHIAYPKTAQLLKAEGTLALLWNMMPTFEQHIEERLRDIFDSWCPGLGDASFNKGAEVASDEGLEELEASKLFHTIERSWYAWTITLTAIEFTRLLSTFGNFQALPSENRSQLLGDVESWINGSLGDHIECRYKTVLHLCKRSGTRS